MQAGESVEVPGAAASADVHYYIDGGALHIEEAAGSSDKTRAAERCGVLYSICHLLYTV
jgi:hypothetical protein